MWAPNSWKLFHLIGETYNPPLELTGDRGNDCVTWEADPKAWCSWNTCVWSSNQAGKQSDYSAAAVLWESQTKWRGHVWALRLAGQQPGFRDSPAQVPGESGASKRSQAPALLSHFQPLGLSSGGPRNHRAVTPSVHCPNSWPRESIKWLFEVAKFWGKFCFCSTSNRNPYFSVPIINLSLNSLYGQVH